MTDAELIYNACLRAERRIEAQHAALKPSAYGWHADDLEQRRTLKAALIAVHTLREEIGRGFNDAYRR